MAVEGTPHAFDRASRLLSAAVPSCARLAGRGFRHRRKSLPGQLDGHDRRLLQAAWPRVRRHEVQADVQPVHRAVDGVLLLSPHSEEVGRGGQLWCLPARDAPADGIPAKYLSDRVGHVA